jgi:hypothetical protein
MKALGQLAAAGAVALAGALIAPAGAMAQSERPFGGPPPARSVEERPFGGPPPQSRSVDRKSTKCRTPAKVCRLETAQTIGSSCACPGTSAAGTVE